MMTRCAWSLSAAFLFALSTGCGSGFSSSGAGGEAGAGEGGGAGTGGGGASGSGASVAAAGTPSGGAAAGAPSGGGAGAGGASGGGAGAGATSSGGAGGTSSGGASTGGAPSGGAATGGTSSGGVEAGGAGASNTGGLGGASDCPSGRGSPMVRVPAGESAFCIDAYETTRADYARFLEEGPVAPPPAYCAWNTDYDPQLGNEGDSNLPVVGVDFCDARAYCEWAGKRLCGRIGGGAAAFDRFDDSSESQWFAACSRGGTRVFPYGNDYDGTRCNGADYRDADALVLVGTTTCEGGYEGIFDLSGNAWEWENSCTGTAGVEDQCRLRSGEFSNPEGFLRCDYGAFYIGRDFRSNSIGIRCCGP